MIFLIIFALLGLSLLVAGTVACAFPVWSSSLPSDLSMESFRLLRWTTANYPNIRITAEITEGGKTRTAEFIGWQAWWRHFPSFELVRASDPVDRWLNAQYERIEYERSQGCLVIEAQKRVGGAS